MQMSMQMHQTPPTMPLMAMKQRNPDDACDSDRKARKAGYDTKVIK